MRYVLFGLLMVISAGSYSQQRVRSYFNDKDNEVDSVASTYVKVGKKNHRNYWVGTVRTYYTASSHLRSVEEFNDKGMRNGVQKYYFDNGALKKEHVFSESKIVGASTGYYENRSPHYRLKFPNTYNLENDEHKVIDYWDSVGNQLVKNGNGKCRCYVTILSEIYRQDGTVVDTLREGEWLTYKKDSLIFRETYEHGKLTSGIRYTKSGEQISYTESMKMPQPTEGLESLYQWIGRNVKYPADARRLGIEGTVYVGFVVAKTGALQEIKTVQGVGASLDAESERVMSLLQPWSPGLFKGNPMAVRYVLPIKFKLEGLELEEEKGKKKKRRRGNY